MSELMIRQASIKRGRMTDEDDMASILLVLTVFKTSKSHLHRGL